MTLIITLLRKLFWDWSLPKAVSYSLVLSFIAVFICFLSFLLLSHIEPQQNLGSTIFPLIIFCALIIEVIGLGLGIGSLIGGMVKKHFLISFLALFGILSCSFFGFLTYGAFIFCLSGGYRC